MILVTGATGEYGKLVVDFLLEKSKGQEQIGVLARSAEKASQFSEKGLEVRIGDYNEPASLASAFQGVHKLLFVSGSDVVARESQHQNIVQAAKEAGVNHILYTSFIRKPEFEDSAIEFLQQTHRKTENWIKDSGINYTILQHALYMDMIPMFAGENVLESGNIVQPAGQGRANTVMRKDLAEAAANILLDTGHENKTYVLANESTYSYSDIADAISKASGKSISYISPSPQEYRSMLSKMEVPEDFINMFTSFAVAQEKGELDLTDHTLEQILGRKPVQYEAFVNLVYGNHGS